MMLKSKHERKLMHIQSTQLVRIIPMKQSHWIWSKFLFKNCMQPPKHELSHESNWYHVNNNVQYDPSIIHAGSSFCKKNIPCTDNY